MFVFRGITKDVDGRPWISHSVARGLGVRVGHDITPDEDGIVHPGQGGPSAADDPSGIPWFLRDEPAWALDSDELSDYLACREDSDREGHVFIEPAYAMEIEDFKTAVEETRDLWREIG